MIAISSMTASVFARCALGTCVVTVMLAACGGSQPAGRRAGRGAAKPRGHNARLSSDLGIGDMLAVTLDLAVSAANVFSR